MQTTSRNGRDRADNLDPPELVEALDNFFDSFTADDYETVRYQRAPYRYEALSIKTLTRLIEAAAAYRAILLAQVYHYRFVPSNKIVWQRIANEDQDVSELLRTRRQKALERIKAAEGAGEKEILHEVRAGLEAAQRRFKNGPQAQTRANDYVVAVREAANRKGEEFVVRVPFVYLHDQTRQTGQTQTTASAHIEELIVRIAPESGSVDLPAWWFRSEGDKKKAETKAGDIVDETCRRMAYLHPALDITIRHMDYDGGFYDRRWQQGIQGDSYLLGFAVAVACYVKTQRGELSEEDLSRILRHVYTGGINPTAGSMGGITEDLKVKVMACAHRKDVYVMVLPGSGGNIAHSALLDAAEKEFDAVKAKNNVISLNTPRNTKKTFVPIDTLNDCLKYIGLLPYSVAGLPWIAVTLGLIATFGIYVRRDYLALAPVTGILGSGSVALGYVLYEVWRLGNRHRLSFKPSWPKPIHLAALTATLLAMGLAWQYGTPWVVTPPSAPTPVKAKIEEARKTWQESLDARKALRERGLESDVRAILAGSDKFIPEERAEILGFAGQIYKSWPDKQAGEHQLRRVAEQFQKIIDEASAREDWNLVITFGDAARNALSGATDAEVITRLDSIYVFLEQAYNKKDLYEEADSIRKIIEERSSNR